MQGYSQRHDGYVLLLLPFLFLVIFGSGFPAEEHLRSHDGKQNPSGDGERIGFDPQVIEDIISKDDEKKLDQ